MLHQHALLLFLDVQQDWKKVFFVFVDTQTFVCQKSNDVLEFRDYENRSTTQICFYTVSRHRQREEQAADTSVTQPWHADKLSQLITLACCFII